MFVVGLGWDQPKSSVVQPGGILVGCREFRIRGPVVVPRQASDRRTGYCLSILRVEAHGNGAAK